jgi:hypothetical protein
MLPFQALAQNTQEAAPQAVNFQGVARNPSGNVLPNKPVSLRISILNGGESGPAEYVETHAVTTSAQGLFNLPIGKGTPVSGSFAGINWAAATAKFFKLEIDAAGGRNYTVMGTQQLLSVPYALFAEKTRLTAGSGITVTGNSTITNSAPDKVVTLQGAGAATVSGTYPDFTISSADAQKLSLEGNQLSLTNGGTVTLPAAQTPWVANGNNIHYSGGNVGINTPTPSTTLDVNGVMTTNQIDMRSPDNGLVKIFMRKEDLSGLTPAPRVLNGGYTFGDFVGDFLLRHINTDGHGKGVTFTIYGYVEGAVAYRYSHVGGGSYVKQIDNHIFEITPPGGEITYRLSFDPGISVPSIQTTKGTVTTSAYLKMYIRQFRDWNW